MSEQNPFQKADHEIIQDSGKFFEQANRKFTGSPKGLLEKTAEKADWPR
jgi:hypothetical protein